MKILYFSFLFVLFLTLCRLTAPKIPEGEKVDFDVSIPETGCVCPLYLIIDMSANPHNPPALDIAEGKGKDKSTVDLSFDFSKRLLCAP